MLDGGLVAAQRPARRACLEQPAERQADPVTELVVLVLDERAVGRAIAGERLFGCTQPLEQVATGQAGLDGAVAGAETGQATLGRQEPGQRRRVAVGQATPKTMATFSQRRLPMSWKRCSASASRSAAAALSPARSAAAADQTSA